MLTAFAYWIRATPLGWAAAGGVVWLGPACLTLHFIGLVLLVGCVFAFDLRLLGVAKGLPVAPLGSLMPWAVLGFLINLTTGLTLLAGNPFQYIDNPAFWLKMLFVVLAGVNVIIYYSTGLARRAAAVASGQDAPFSAKTFAAMSLFLWIGVIYWGRMLLFIGNFF
ncbi:MAG: hypothetical protein A3G76_00540 [Acidobacteria bacterium RIFCSPLOWO2_12_FULL_65_11]|nr:MAG: hypothetical protein A3H95_06925 [Acidobacteria bacterium RIFCSPLOWO2_02_FULL_64_15]OFW34150.1 MAG: hypothetical protein A3G76_00540 [Acidobacteria bacterium RIFCSPLOWO2_12_FULL_65_11]